MARKYHVLVRFTCFVLQSASFEINPPKLVERIDVVPATEVEVM